MKLAVIAVFVCAARLFAQQPIVGARDSLTAVFTIEDTSLNLHHQFILYGSQTIYLDSLPMPDSVYFLDNRNGILRVSELFIKHYISADTMYPHRVRIWFSYLPFSFLDRYSHRDLVYENDSLLGRIGVAVPSKSEPITMENIFGKNFQKSGTLIRGITIGTNQDATVASGFHMQFSGTLAQDVDVVGELTDNNTPIQPEGNTQSIQELDKIFITVKSPFVTSTLGDFDAVITGSEFANISRKVEGGEAIANTSFGSAHVIAATTRGKYMTNQFQGQDGAQGPYILTGENNENSIIIIAGSELVYVDGQQQQRGENLDYVIDYSTGQVTFQTRRLITAASRIVIDFQYSDNQYSRSLLAAQVAVPVGGDTAVKFITTYIREADNQNAPLSVTLADSDIALLAGAGGNPAKASRSGIQLAPIDSTTNLTQGYYAMHDTIINGVLDTIMIYAPGDSNALYTVTFTYVGAGKGTYNLVAGLQYQWVGSGQGAYLPVVYLPMPTLTQIADERVSAGITKSLSATAEFAFSDHVNNLFSTLPGSEVMGSAGSFSLLLAPDKYAFGTLQGTLHVRSISPLFTPIDRIDEVEFARDWNLPADYANEKQNIYEGTAAYSPIPQIQLTADIGELQWGDSVSTRRQIYSIAAQKVPALTVVYHYEILKSAGLSTINSSAWTRQNGNAAYTLGIFTPTFHFEAEQKKENAYAVDSLGNPIDTLGYVVDTLDQTSYKYTLLQPGVRVAPSKNISLYGSATFRTDDSALANAFQQQSQTRGGSGGFTLHNFGGVTSDVSLSVLNKTIDSAFVATSGANNQSLAMRMQTNLREADGFLTGDLYYQAATQRAAKLQQRFVLVPVGTGQYIYLGDLNHDGVQDPNEFQLTAFNNGNYSLVYLPTQELYPDINLNTSARVRLTLSVLFPHPSGDLQTILSSVSSESYARVQENSTTPDTKDIYLLQFSHFLDPTYTLNGAQQFEQDIYILQNSSDFSMRARYTENRGLAQYATTDEVTYQSEQSLRIRWHLVPEISDEIDLAKTRDEVSSSGLTQNTPRMLHTTDFTSDLSYRPYLDVETGWKLELRTTTDDIVSPAVVAAKDYNNVHVTYSFTGKGSLRFELERDEVVLSSLPSGYVPSFQLTDGYLPGQTYIARAILQYRITSAVQASANYIGRLNVSSIPVHTFQAEVRALF